MFAVCESMEPSLLCVMRRSRACNTRFDTSWLMRTERARLEMLHGRRVYEIRRHVLRLLQPLLVELLELARRRGACRKSNPPLVGCSHVQTVA